MKTRISTYILGSFAILLVFGAGLALTIYGDTLLRTAEMVSVRVLNEQQEAFPEIDESALNTTQRNIVRISREEYARMPVSYDVNVLKYSNQVIEPWCANYVSWVMREAGVRFSNPNSGGWRIPGVLTLKDYYYKSNRFRDARSYEPQVGDVAIYVNTSSFNTTRQHANIVLKVEGDMVTTIGGNERGRLRVQAQRLVYGEKGLVGYGILP
jgi:hypothetical protein